MIRSLGQQIGKQYGQVKDAFSQAADTINQWSPNAQSDVQIAGTNNGGLTNPYAPDTSQAQYGGYVGDHAITWAGGGGDRNSPGAHWQTAQAAGQAADPLFYSPGQQMPTSGESRQGPNAYRYPGSEGWVASPTSTAQPMQRG